MDNRTLFGQIFFGEVRASFNLREPKANKPTNIYLVCRLNGKQIRFSTGVKAYPEQWNKGKQEAYISCRLTELDNLNNTVTNERLAELKARFLECKHYLCEHPDEIEQGVDLLRKFIYKDKMAKKQETENAIHWLRNALIADSSIKDSTRNDYVKQIKFFEVFLRETGRYPICFNDINLPLIMDYQAYLFNKTVGDEKTTKTTTVGNKVEKIIVILRRAEKQNKIDIREAKLDKYQKPKSRQGDENEIYLTEEEIDKIYALELDGMEEQVRDLFVLQCWIGQRFKDTQAINEGIIKETPNGRVIEIVQEKKTHKVSIPLLPIANEILNKYKGRFPIFTNQTALNYLTKIGEKAGIKRLHNVTEDRGGNVITKQLPAYKLIKTHTARRSFVCNMLKRGYDSQLIMKITGHRDVESFQKYIKIIPDDAANVILDREARKEESKEKQTNQPVTKSKIDVLDYLFAEDSLLRLDELQNKGIDIYDLTELKEAINIIKDTKRTDKPKKFLAGFDKSTLFTRIDKLDGIIWDIARRCFDFTLYQVFQQKVIELGLSERIKEVMDRDEMDGFWYQEYSLGKLEEENGF